MTPVCFMVEWELIIRSSSEPTLGILDNDTMYIYVLQGMFYKAFYVHLQYFSR